MRGRDLVCVMIGAFCCAFVVSCSSPEPVTIPVGLGAESEGDRVVAVLPCAGSLSEGASAAAQRVLVAWLREHADFDLEAMTEVGGDNRSLIVVGRKKR